MTGQADVTREWAIASVDSFLDERISMTEFCEEEARLGLWANRLPDEDPRLNLLWHFCMWVQTLCWQHDDGDLTHEDALKAAEEMRGLLVSGQESWAQRVEESDSTLS